MKIDPRLANAAVGTKLGPVPYQLPAGTNRRLLAAAGNPWSAAGRTEPTVAGNVALAVFLLAVPGQMVHTAQRSRHHAVVPEGSAVEASGIVTGCYAKRGRVYVDIDYEAVLPDGRLAWDGTISAITPNVPADGLPERPGRPPLVVEGSELSSVEHTFDLAGMTEFSGPGNAHSDQRVAEAIGLDRPVVQGMHTAALLARLLGERWGDRWLDSAEWDVRFVGMAWPGETVRAALVAPPPGAAGRDSLGLRATKTDGSVVLVGTAALAGEAAGQS